MAIGSVFPHPSSSLIDEDGRLSTEWYQAIAGLYQEGEWTPAFTFATPGDLAFTYSVQLGHFHRTGNLVTVQFVVASSAFTHTTAAGNAQITGLPFLPRNELDGNNHGRGPLLWRGITKAGYTEITNLVSPGLRTIEFRASGSGLALSAVTTADMPTGGTVALRGAITYFATS